MHFSTLFYLTSGLFLGWALGANLMGNVFGTAVGSRMIKFPTAAVICSIFVVLGAVIGGSDAAHTIGKLAVIETLAGAFVAAFAAGLSVFVMTKIGIPVSTTQAIFGSILGWSLFTGKSADMDSVLKVFSAWIASPILAATFSVILMLSIKLIFKKFPIPMLYMDLYTRIALIIAGAFGAYSLGANNIANVMGVFVKSSPLPQLTLFDFLTLAPEQVLFLLGGLAIAVGVITYSKKVIQTVGSGLLDLSPIAAWVVVMAHSLVLFIFSSKELKNFLIEHNLPPIPLVPVSSSEAVIGAIIGIALLQKGSGLRWKSLSHIGLAWITSPIISCSVCFVSMYIMQNVFNQKVF
ncbi:MAG: inorganic phosphate transporter [Alphaproteobacteria bacterium]